MPNSVSMSRAGIFSDRLFDDRLGLDPSRRDAFSQRRWDRGRRRHARFRRAVLIVVEWITNVRTIGRSGPVVARAVRGTAEHDGHCWTLRAEPHVVATAQVAISARRDLLVVDEGSVRAVLVVQPIARTDLPDLAMTSRHVEILLHVEEKITRWMAADRDDVLVKPFGLAGSRPGQNPQLDAH